MSHIEVDDAPSMSALVSTAHPRVTTAAISAPRAIALDTDGARDLYKKLQSDGDRRVLLSMLGAGATFFASIVAAGTLPVGLPFVLLASAASFLGGRALVGRELDRFLEEKHGTSLSWRRLRALYHAAGVRDLDEPEARLHRPIDAAERIARFERALHAALVEPESSP